MDLFDFKFYIAECLTADAAPQKGTESPSEIEDEPLQKKAKRSMEPLPPKDVRVYRGSTDEESAFTYMSYF